MSLAKALIGEIYTQYTLSSNLPSSANLNNLSIIERNAVRVLPLPVGLQSNRLSPLEIDEIAIF
jgi:hypothetical protein